MNQAFQQALSDPNRFVVTLELVPGAEAHGRKVDAVLSIARDALADGRVSAVSITDNPGGNPALSPDVIGREILDLGMDVIVHFTCRDLNRAAIESRALQLARMGMRNILALTGDYTAEGFGGRAAPVFDLDSVTLTCLLGGLREGDGDDDRRQRRFFTGCAVSPFKADMGETLLQYAKLRMKARAGARFVITQVGYDARKFHELLRVQLEHGLNQPTLGSVFLLTPGVARAMAAGRVPGAIVAPSLLQIVEREWTDPIAGRTAAIERAARLAAVLKGLGYRGIHLGGIRKSFAIVAEILDRFDQIADRWREFLPDFDHPQEGGFYVYRQNPGETLSNGPPMPCASRRKLIEHAVYCSMRGFHEAFFNHKAKTTKAAGKLLLGLDRSRIGRLAIRWIEDPSKSLLFDCRKCGDCAIEHVGFLCPESQCPKHMRNGPCGGSALGKCEVHADRPCVWVRAWERMAASGEADRLVSECVPPRRWELDQTSSWINFHRRRDHHNAPCEMLRDNPTCPAGDKGSATK